MSRNRVYLCGDDFDPALLNPPVPPLVTTCADHTSAPPGYLNWHSWARSMSKTHKQEKCDECGLFSIWRPKRSGQQKMEAS